MKGKFFFLVLLMTVIFISLGSAEVVIFEENFNDFTGWNPAPENSAGCEWTAENGCAKIKSMGTNPYSHIFAKYEHDLPLSISPDQDFSFKAYIRCLDGDPFGSTSATWIELVTESYERVVMLM